MKRICRKCGEEKELEEFAKDKSRRLRYRSICKNCHYELKLTICVRCDFCKIIFRTTSVQAKNNNHYCTHFCYSLSLRGQKGAYKDLTGKKFGSWTVIKDSGERKNHTIIWLCKCDCGNNGKIAGNSLASGGSSSCGCSLVINLTDKRFGRLLVKKRSYIKNNRIYWLCKCDCGTEKSIDGNPLRRGVTVSCGCYGKKNLFQKEVISNRRLDVYGNRYGRLTVVGESLKKKNEKARRVKCLCDCGTEIDILLTNLTTGKQKSCGCLRGIIRLMAFLKKYKDFIDRRNKGKLSKNKKCASCKEINGKDGCGFNVCNKNLDGLSSVCKKCRRKIISKSQFKNVTQLSNSYIINAIKNTKTGVGLEVKDITPETIQLKREIITFNRLQKELTNGINSRGNKRTSANGKAA